MAKISALAGLITPITTSLGEAVGSLNDASTSIGGVGAQLEKAKNEIIGNLGDVEIPEAAMAGFNQLAVLAEQLKASSAAIKTGATGIQTASQALDDLNPDAPASPETPASPA